MSTAYRELGTVLLSYVIYYAKQLFIVIVT